MALLSGLLGRQRRQLKQQARVSSIILVLAILGAVFCFSVFLMTFLGSYPLSFGQGLFANNPERILGASNFFMMTAITAALRMWRRRRTRIQMLIAEALIRENDEDTAMRLLLEPMFGEDVWFGTEDRLVRG